MGPFFPQHADEFAKVIETLKGRRVAVLGHIRPDGDCIGSQVALCRILNAIGCEAVALNGDDVPRVLLSFVKDTPFYHADEIDSNGWIAVNVDCADPVRTGKVLNGRHREIFLNIDHHVSNTIYAEHNFVHSELSATAEVLAGLVFDLDLPLDPVSAQALYIGIATDTGQFRFGATTREVFQICARLAENGADPAAAALELYENETMAKVDLLQRFLASFRFECGGKVCIGILPDGVYGETGAHKEDSEGLVDYARAIEGVEIGVLLEERDSAIKGSFRAKDPIHKVHDLARSFNGGGHACAAGFNMNGKTLDGFYDELVTRLEEHFSKLSLNPDL